MNAAHDKPRNRCGRCIRRAFLTVIPVHDKPRIHENAAKPHPISHWPVVVDRRFTSIWSHAKCLHGTAGRQGDDFWQFSAQVGYRFARNRCEVSAGILNLTDTNYRLDPINYLDTLPRSRTAVLRCKITF